jgi:hypothetical protein
MVIVWSADIQFLATSDVELVSQEMIKLVACKCKKIKRLKDDKKHFAQRIKELEEELGRQGRSSSQGLTSGTVVLLSFRLTLHSPLTQWQMIQWAVHARNHARTLMWNTQRKMTTILIGKVLVMFYPSDTR